MQKKKYYLWKRGKVYYAKFRDPATGKILADVSTGYGNATRAALWADERYADMERAAGKGDLTVGDYANRFFTSGCPHVERLRDEGRSYSDTTMTQNRVYVEVDIITDEIANKRLSELKRNDLLEFRSRVVARRGRSRSAQTAYGALRIIIREAVHRGLLEVDPSAGIQAMVYEKKRRPALSIEDMQKFVAIEAWADVEYWRPTLCAAITGMRSGEIRGLRWPSVDKARSVIMVVDNIPCRSTDRKLPKWGKPRVTVYPKMLQQILEPLRESDGYVFGRGNVPLDYDKWHKAVVQARTLSKVPLAGIHTLRHSIQTHLRGKGVADDLLRGAFGWSNASVQDNYTHRELYDMAPLAAELDKISEQ